MKGRGKSKCLLRRGGKADGRAKNIYWQTWALRLLVGCWESYAIPELSTIIAGVRDAAFGGVVEE